MNRRATVESVLVYHIGSLGDTLMAAPALWALRAHWPAAHVALLTKRTQFGHVVLSGSLWVMHHLNSNMMPGAHEMQGMQAVP